MKAKWMTLTLTIVLITPFVYAAQTASVKENGDDSWSVRLSAGSPYSIVEPGEAVHAKVVLENHASEPRSGTCQWSVESMDGMVHGGGVLSVDLSSPSVSLPIEMTSLEKNFYWLKARIMIGDSSEDLRLPIGVIDKTRNESSVDPFFCINSHERLNNDEILLMTWANVGSVRLHYSWNEQERTKGEHVFVPEVLSWRKALADSGVQFFPILAYGNPGYTDDDRLLKTEEQLNGYAEYCRQQVRQWGGPGGVRYWEVWNEPNIQIFWHGSPEQYFELLKRAYTAIKEEDPKARVVGLSTAGVPFDWIEEQLRLGALDYCDAVSVHPYNYPNPPESYLQNDLKKCRELLDRFGGEDHPLLITEIGWPTHEDSRGVSLLDEASLLVRSYVETYHGGLVKKFFWYDLRNDGNDPNYNEHNFGIMFHDLTPKPAYVAFAFMSRMLEGAMVHQSPIEDESLRTCSFVKEGRFITVVWNWRGESLLSLGEQEAQLFSMFGTPMNAADILTVGPEPVSIVSSDPLRLTRIIERRSGAMLSSGIWNPVRYTCNLTGKCRVSFHTKNGLKVTPSSIEFSGAQTQAEFHLKPEGKEEEVDAELIVAINGKEYRIRQEWSVSNVLEMEVRVDDDGRKALCNLHNLSDERLKASLQIRNETGTFETRKVVTLKPKRERRVTVKLPEEVIGREPFEVVAVVRTESDKIFSVGQLFQNQTLTRMQQPPTIDGSLDEWPENSSFILNKEEDWARLTSDYSGAKDASARCWIAGDSHRFYLAAEVFDDIHFQPSVTGDFWKGDSLQFAISDSHRDPSAKLSDTFEFDLAMTANGPQWTRGRGKIDPQSADVVFSATREAPFTNYEISIPWSVLGINPEPTKVLGFSLIVNDNDGRGREGWLGWADGIGWNKNPAQYGDIWIRE